MKIIMYFWLVLASWELSYALDYALWKPFDNYFWWHLLIAFLDIYLCHEAAIKLEDSENEE